MAHPRGRAAVFRLFAILAVLMLLIAACSGGDGDDDDAMDASGGAPAASPAGAVGDGAEAEEAAADADQAGADARSGESRPIVYQPSPDDRLVIRSAQLTLTVSDVAEATTWVRDLAGQTGGYVFGASTYIEDESQYAQITIKVPADQFDTAINQINSAPFVVQVNREETSSQDVSAEYVDNEARLEALEETQRRYLALLAGADNIDAIVRIETELTDIRSQIESIKGRQQYLEEMTAYSTITMTFQPEDGEPVDGEEDDGFLARIFIDSWDRASGVIEGLLEATVTLGIIFLAVAPFALIAYLLFRYVRSRIERPIPPEPQRPTVEG